METQKTYALLVVAVAAVSSGLTFQAFDFVEDSPTGTADTSGVFGHLTATLFDEDGYVKAYRQTDNRIVDEGLDLLADRTFGTTIAPVVAAVVDTASIGTGGGISAVGQTDLTSRAGLGGACANVTNAFIEGGTGTGLVNVTSTFTFLGTNGCDGTINEAALFDAAGGSSGNMFARQSFGGIVVGGSDQLDITWSVQVNDDGNE